MADRRDKKNRRLMYGESQDKYGRYSYKYTDALGKRKTLYSWRLTEADPTPIGKRQDLSLREKIKKVQKDLQDGIITDGGNFTVLTLVEKYIYQKRGVRHNTRANYKFIVNLISKDPFGRRRIDKVKISDATK